MKDGFDEGLDSFSDEEMDELVVDEEEDGCTTVDAAMLVNVGGSVDGVQTELYDSGASRHMSPCQEHFENYVPIVPKSITTADKCYFQAIGKGDLCIKLPNGHMTTTILLKDVLHCPDMGLTLVSIGKITAAGYKVLFRGSTCKIFDSKDKIIGQVNVKNGLYCVDHDKMVNVGIAGEACEVLTLEELHRRMGHITPETAKKMVSSGAARGIEIDFSTVIQSCDSCELWVLFIGLILILIWMGQKFGPCNTQLSSKTQIPRNSALTTAITMTCSIIGLDLPKNLQVQLSGLLWGYLSG